MGMITGIGKAVGVAGTAATGVEALQKAWETANKDGKLTDAAASARAKAAAAAAARSPLARLERALDAADAAVAEFSPADETGRAAQQRWASEAATLRSKMTPLAGYEAGKQRKITADLRRRADALLDEIVGYGLEPRTPRRRALGRGPR